MKIIPKSQNRLVAKSDNTRVIQQPIIFPIKYKLKSGETFITDRNTGKKVLVKQKNETISADRRSAYQKQQDQKKAQQIHKRYKENKNQEEGMKNLQGFFNLISPSTYIGPVFNNNDKSYLDNVMSGEGTGDIAGNLAIDMLTPFAVGGAKSLATNMVKYPQNIGRRAVETAMRTTPLANPLPEISNNFHTMLQGDNGGKTRLFHIGNYILTGKKIGPKGYYNSFAPFVSTSDPITMKVSLRDRIRSFTQPNGISYAYSGYVNRLGQVPPHPDGNDIIDAFLYNKTIDPKFGVQKVEPDYGIHTNYVRKWYPNKRVQVYEVQNNTSIPEQDVIPEVWESSNTFSNDFGTTYDNVLNAAGHLKQNGIYNGQKVVRHQDIWKFNPAEYKQKWFHNKSDYNSQPLYKKKLLDIGLRYVDKIGTPVITRTKWVYE